MNINQIYSNQQNTHTLAVSGNQSNNIKTGLKKRKRDTGEKMTATSGKDTLGITKGDKDNSYVILFADSAMVSRAVHRGYITVNGRDFQLSEETKQQLLKTNKQAQAEREKAYQKYVMQHEMAVAKQQSESVERALEKAFGSTTDIVDIFDIIFGKTVRPKQYENAVKAYKNTQEGVSWSQFEWKGYDTRMKLDVGNTIKVEDISIGEIILNEKCKK